MARLQRKKTAKPKKKKDPSAPAVETAAANGDGGAVTVTEKAAAAPAKEPKKPRVYQPKKAPAAAGEPGKIVGWFQTAVQFLREVKVELKKVTWPSRKQTIGSTVVVLVLVTIIAFFLGAADIALSSLIRVVLQ